MTATVPMPVGRAGRTTGLRHSRLGVVIGHDLKLLLPGWFWQSVFINVVWLLIQPRSTSAYRSVQHMEFGWMAGLLFALNLLNGELESDTIEPLLASGIRRWEIVVGKLVVIGLCFLMFLIVLATFTLATLALAVLSPHLLHPPDLRTCTIAVFELLAANAAWGLELVALALCCGVYYLSDKGRGNYARTTLLMCAPVLMNIELFRFSWAVMFCPLANCVTGTTLILWQLELPANLHQIGSHGVPGLNPFYFPVLFSAPLIMTAIFTALAIKALGRLSFAKAGTSGGRRKKWRA